MLAQQPPTIDPAQFVAGPGGATTAVGEWIAGISPWVPIVVVACLGLLLGVFVGLAFQRFRDARTLKNNRPRWPRDWPPPREIFSSDPNPMVPGYQKLLPRQAIGSGAMPIGRTYPRWRILPNIYPLKDLRRRVEYWSSKPVWLPYTKRFQHFAVLGKTGGGKSTAFAIPILAYGAHERNAAYFAIDVKSPAFSRMFASLYKRAGKDVIFFDPWSPDETLACEPLWRASDERIDIIADVIATYSTDASQQSSSENSEFFRVAAIRLLRGLLDLSQYWPRRYVNLPCIQQLVGAGGNVLKEAFEVAPQLMPTLDETIAAVETVLPATPEQLRARNRPDLLQAALAILDRSGYRLAFVIKRMRRYEAETIQGRRDPAELEEIRKAFWVEIKAIWRERKERLAAVAMNQGEFISAPEETRNSVVSTLTNKVNWFRDPNIAKALSRDELDIRTLVERPCLFLVGAPMAKLKVGSLFVASILSNLAINAIFQRGMAIERGDPRVSKHGIFLLLDEFPQLQIKSAPSILATFRGFLSGLIMVYQERAQLKMLYGEDVSTMDGNTVHKILLQGAQEETAEYYATKTIGEAPVVKRSKSGARGEKQSYSESVENMPLATTQDVRFGRLNGRVMPNLAFSVGSDVPAFPLRPVPYYEDPTLRQMLGLRHVVSRKGPDGKRTRKFWQWSDRWEPTNEGAPYLKRRPPRPAAAQGPEGRDPVMDRRADPYTQYLDYLLGDNRTFDQLVEPRLVLTDVGVTQNAPAAAMAGFGPGMDVPPPAAPAARSAPVVPPSTLVPAYGTDFRILINADFRREPAAIPDRPAIGGPLAERIDALSAWTSSHMMDDD